MTRQRLLALLVPAVLLLLLAWAGSILWSAIDEGAVPSDSAFPQIPPAGEKVQVSRQCGSGGCWREMVVRIDSTRIADSVAGEMGLAPERCGPLNLWTLRRTCTGLVSSSGEELTIYLRYSPLISKY